MKLRSAILLLFSLSLMQFSVADEQDNTVVIKDFEFAPKEITIKLNETVRWENKEKRQYHNVWFEALNEEEPDYIFPDESFQRVFKKVGTFPYRCGPHPRMTGVVHVIE